MLAWVIKPRTSGGWGGGGGGGGGGYMFRCATQMNIGKSSVKLLPILIRVASNILASV